MLKLFAALLTFIVLSCHNPKTASKTNFKVAIQIALDKRPECLIVSMPNERPDMQGTDPQSEALVAAGLADKRHTMIENHDYTLFGGPKKSSGTRYDFTPEGRKYLGHSGALFFALDSPTEGICYGTPEVIDIVRYSEPGNAMGRTATEVTYTYELKSVAPWAKNPAMLRQFPELSRIQTPDHPDLRISQGDHSRRFYVWRYNLVAVRSFNRESKFVPLVYKLKAVVRRHHKGRSLTRIFECDGDRKGLSDFWNGADLDRTDPRSLILAKVSMGIAPLKESNDRIADNEERRYELSARLPPLKGAIPLMLGFTCGMWGWVNAREGKRLPASGYVFWVSTVLWIWGLFIVLPWLADL